MRTIYSRIRERAHQIVSLYPDSDFYKDHSAAYRQSLRLFETDPVIAGLKAFVDDHMEDDFGHGPGHAAKVAIDTGALLIIERDLSGCPEKLSERRTLLAQSAGLLHDIKRKQKNHAAEGAVYARIVLKDYPFSDDEIDDVCNSIHNHQAFKNNIQTNSLEGALISDCLYDADKFRWGPDNFKNTVWDMVSYLNPPLSVFIDQYPKGMEGLAKIKDTFRTQTGKKYGPQFIDLGLAIGDELLRVIKTEFAEYI